MAEVKGTEGTSIRSLLSSVSSDAQHLLKAQVELTKTELKQAGSQAAGVGGMFVGAAAAGLLGGLFLLVTIAYGLVALGLPTWGGFGIVTLVLIVVAAILALTGRSKSAKITGPQRAMTEWELTGKMLSGKAEETLPATATLSAIERKGNTSQAPR